jgi:hypothetical protein
MIQDEQPEPDSIETTTINLLVEAMCDGDEHLAAHALRLLADLDEFALAPEVLATFFDGPKESKIQPRWLTLEKRGKGRPRKPRDISKLTSLGLGQAIVFFHYLASRNTAAAATALRDLPKLQGIQLGLLADLFDDSPSLHHIFPWRLRLVARVGSPGKRLRFPASEIPWARALSAALKKFPGKKEAAIQEVMTQTGKSRSSINDAIKRFGLGSPAK